MGNKRKMTNMHYELAASSWGEEEIRAIESVIARDQYTMGQSVATFEREFAKKFGSRFGIMVNSGSSANLLAINAMLYKKEKPFQPGDEIIVPSLSWSTTYYPIHQCGMKLVFVDIDLETLNLDVTQLENGVSEKTRAVFVPHILGNAADLDAIQSFCDKYDLYLIEDNCESMGATWKGKPTGTFGICGTFSTFFSHHMATMEGGMILTDDEEMYHIMLSMRSHGWTRHLPQENLVCEKNADLFYESFRFVLPGYNFRPVEMSGAVGLEQLKKLDGFIEKRQENAVHFVERFSGDERFIIQRESGISSWFGFSLVIRPDSRVDRSRVVQALNAANIDVRPVVTGNFLVNDVIKHLNHRVVGKHLNSQAVHDYGLFVGNHHFDIRSKINYLHQVLESVQLNSL